jgi:hypothetical protein
MQITGDENNNQKSTPDLIWQVAVKTYTKILSVHVHKVIWNITEFHALT